MIGGQVAAVDTLVGRKNGRRGFVSTGIDHVGLDHRRGPREETVAGRIGLELDIDDPRRAVLVLTDQFGLPQQLIAGPAEPGQIDPARAIGVFRRARRPGYRIDRVTDGFGNVGSIDLVPFRDFDPGTRRPTFGRHVIGRVGLAGTVNTARVVIPHVEGHRRKVGVGLVGNDGVCQFQLGHAAGLALDQKDHVVVVVVV